MQLNLFEDNLPTVLLNIAEEFIRSRAFAQAVSVYDQLLADRPDDKKVAALRKLVAEWLDPLCRIGNPPRDPELLRSIWERLDAISLPALRSVALDMLIEAMNAFPDPAKIHASPRFHLGQMLMQKGRFSEAADCFQDALENDGIARGMLLAWRGDALTMARKSDAALKSYLAAFLEDPLSVDMPSIRNQTIHKLHLSLHFDGGEDVDEDDEPGWLPVWGWFNGVFPLPSLSEPEAQEPPSAAAFEVLLAEAGCPVPRIWYHMLAHAERLRLASRDDREMTAVRRLMKRANHSLFACYLEKINGRR